MVHESTVISIENVTFTYLGSKEPALKNISLKIKEGEKVLITGHAGAGKTTLCYLLNGLVPHFFRGEIKGNVYVKGYNTKQYDVSFLSHIVGMLFQDPASQLIAPTVEDELAFGAENYGIQPNEIRRRIDLYIKLLRLERYREHNPHFLSGGQQQACALGPVLVTGPEILVLDEPTSNLDPIGTNQVFDVLNELSSKERKTLIIVEHKLEELLPIVDRVVVLKKGEMVFDGKPRELIYEEELEKLGIRIPQVTLLTRKLKKKIPEIKVAMTLEEAVETLEKIFLERNIKKKKCHEAVKRGLLLKTKGKINSSKEKPIIETVNLKHVYPGGIEALRGVTLKIYDGEFVAILGQNGSGKTTLVKHFNGLLLPTEGKVYVFGKDTTKTSVTELSKYVGYVFQNPDFQICTRKVRDELEFGLRNMKLPEDEIKRRVKEVVEALHLENILDENPFSLSKGERQKVVVASVLAMKPKVLIVDEPTTGQDYRTSREMMEFYKKLNEEGKTVIIITHDMELAAEYVSRVIVLNYGKVILDGPTHKVFTQIEKLKEAFLRPPQVTMLAERLSKYGIPREILTVDTMYECLDKSLVGE